MSMRKDSGSAFFWVVIALSNYVESSQGSQRRV